MSRPIPPSDGTRAVGGPATGSSVGSDMGSDVPFAVGSEAESASARPAVREVSSRLRTMSSATQGYADRVSRHLDVHRTDLSAMSVIAQSAARGRSTSAGELARRLLMSPAAVTALVDRLERAGHVRRERDERDRRRVVLGLTGYAGEVSGVMFQPLARHLRAALSAYSDEELDLVARVLDDAIAATRVAVAAPLPEVPEARAMHETHALHDEHGMRDPLDVMTTETAEASTA